MHSRYQSNQDREFDAPDARIVSIEYVRTPVIRALVKHLHGSYAGESVRKEKLPLAEAQTTWRTGDPGRIEKHGTGGDSGNDLSGVQESQMPDVDEFISEIMMQEAKTFKADQHDWYQRHKLAVKVSATCYVLYNNGRNMAKVSGEWCTLTRYMTLHIRGRIERTAFDEKQGRQVTVVDAQRPHRMGAPCGIAVAPLGELSGEQFYQLLCETDNMHDNERRVHVRKYFATSSQGFAQQVHQHRAERQQSAAAGADLLNPIVHSNRSQMRVASASVNHTSALTAAHSTVQQRLSQQARSRNQAFVDALANVVKIDELRQRIKDSKINFKKFVGTEYCALALRMALLSPELQLIAECYPKPATVHDTVARGPEFIATLHELLTTQPHILCFKKLRAKFGEDVNRRELALLPDITLEVYQMLVTRYKLAEQQGDIAAAIDIYSRIMKRDIYGPGNGHPRRNGDPTDGHMFSVLGAHESHRFAEFYHQHGSVSTGAQLREYNSMTHSGRFAMPDEDAWAEQGSKALSRDQRIMLQTDIMRCKCRCSTDQFVSALFWLLKQDIVRTRRYTGTGPHNKGVSFDAFFLTEIHEAQVQSIRLLADIHERAVKQSMHHDPRVVAKPTLVALRAAYADLVAKWRSAYLKTMNNNSRLRKLMRLEQDTPRSLAAANNNNNRVRAPRPSGGNQGADDDDEMSDEDFVDDGEPLTIPALAARVARDFDRLNKQYEAICGELDYEHANDAYADARQSRPLHHWPLTLSADPEALVAPGVRFHDEQIAAAKRLQVEGVSVLTGPGGVGKTQLIGHVLAQYPAEQVACVSFTGQVASEMERRLQHPASTIHSALWRHMRYMSAHFKAAAYRRHRLAKSAPRKAGEDFTLGDVMACDDEQELRAYVEHMLGAYPPFASPFEFTRVLIVDEVSMMSFQLFSQLLRAAHCPEKGRYLERLILVGDINQLPAIGYGNVLSDVAHAMPSVVQQLVVNHRSRGTGIFPLAQALAAHAPSLPMPRFDSISALAALREQDPAQQADIICLETSSGNMRESLELVYDELGAIENKAMRERIQCLAPVNNEVIVANDTIRWLYFGQQESEQGRAASRAVRTIQSSRNSEAAALAEEERRQIADRLAMRMLVGDRVYMKRNETIHFPARSAEEPTRKVQLYNSRLLQCVQFYNAPKKLVGNIRCRCGLCTPDDLKLPGGAPCMQRRDLVPPRRRAELDPAETQSQFYFRYHDDRMPDDRDPTRRMAVFRDQSDNFVEVDVGRHLRPRSRFGNGFALTVHKMQGSQADIVVYLCTNPKDFVTWKHLYTAVTRAKQRVVILSTNAVFDSLARKRDPLRRSSLWYQLGGRVAETLRAFPDAPAARHAQLVAPDMLDEKRWHDADIAWRVFEGLRHHPQQQSASQPDAQAPAAVPSDDNDDDNEASTDDSDLDWMFSCMPARSQPQQDERDEDDDEEEEEDDEEAEEEERGALKRKSVARSDERKHKRAKK
jgi:hypothetical protein